MINKYSCSLLLCLLIPFGKGHAQVTKMLRFNSYNSAGFVAGASPVAFIAQTVNGIQFNKGWFAGIGFGVDNYFSKTLPLFVDVRKEFEWNKINLFVYADAGAHFISKDKKTSTTYSSTVRKGREFLDAGLGCKFKLVKNQHIFLTLGNSLKSITEKETSIDTGYPYHYETTHKLSRLSFKIGYQF